MGAYRKGPRMLTETDVRELLRLAIAARGSAAKWSAAHNLSHSLVSTFLHGKRPPPPVILEALNIERVVSYRPKG